MLDLLKTVWYYEYNATQQKEHDMSILERQYEDKRDLFNNDNEEGFYTSVEIEAVSSDEKSLNEFEEALERVTKELAEYYGIELC